MRRNSAGFTFIDVMIAVVVVGVAVAAVVQSMASGTQANGRATELTIAVNLARNIHEYAVSLPMARVDALDGRNYSPVLDSSGTELTGLPGWTQSVRIYKVKADDVRTNTTETSRLRRLVVMVQYRDQYGNGTVHTANWLFAPTGL